MAKILFTKQHQNSRKDFILVLKDKLQNILPFVTKPGRYLGNEWNAVHKSVSNVTVRFLLAYPDLYEVGMSHLGLKILYDVLNRQEHIWAERVFAPAPDMIEMLKRNNLPLFSLESTTPMADFSFVGFTLQYELNYTTILGMLQLGQVPLWQRERGEKYPFIIAGGPNAFNPEPLADFFDFFVLGDGEEVILKIVDIYSSWKKQGKEKYLFLKEVAQLTGVYAPSFYKPCYRGVSFTGIELLEPSAPAVVGKNIIWELDGASYPTKPLVPYLEVVHDRAVLELFRGCTRGCRFCQAGMVYRPVRLRSPEKLKKMAREIFSNTGYEDLSLLSLSSGDYPDLLNLVRELKEDFAKERLELNLPSLRLSPEKIDAFAAIQDFGKGGLTFAPEAGTQRLRDVINKNITHEDIVLTAQKAVEKGRKSLKLYFMLGLPTETDADLQGIATLVEDILEAVYRAAGSRKGLRISVSSSIFVPKPHTPFQWIAQISRDEMWRRIQLLKSYLKKLKNVSYSYHDPEMSFWEAVLARGDRRLGQALYKAWQKGAYLEGWTDYFSPSYWQKAMAELGLNPDNYAGYKGAKDDPLPWDHLSCGVSKQFLWREYCLSLEDKITEDCRDAFCQGCGLPCFSAPATKE